MVESKRKEMISGDSIANAADSKNALEAFKGALKAIGEQSPEILSGIAATVLPQAAAPIRLFHATAKGNFLRQLLVELEGFRKKGEIKEDYLKSEEAWACFSDMLDFIDKTSPDPKRLKAIKAAFLRSMKNGETGHSAPHSQQLLRTIYGLTSGEIVVLSNIYTMGGGTDMTIPSWQGEVANKSGLLRSELVAEIEDGLISKRLIHPPFDEPKTYPLRDRKVVWGQRNRLTTLGQEVCERIKAD